MQAGLDVKLRELIEQAREALGGQQRLKQIVSFRSDAVRRITGQAAASQFKTHRAVGGRVRLEEIFPTGRQVIQVVNGLTGQKIIRHATTADETVSDLTPEEIASLRREAKILPRNFLVHADEYEVGYLGIGQVENLSGHCIEFRQEQIIYCFNPGSYYCQIMTDSIADSVWAFDDFAAVDGIVTPMKVTKRLTQGVAIEDQLALVRYNEPLPDSLFEVKR
jgi:hypothetical protein